MVESVWVQEDIFVFQNSEFQYVKIDFVFYIILIFLFHVIIVVSYLKENIQFLYFVFNFDNSRQITGYVYFLLYIQILDILLLVHFLSSFAFELHIFLDRQGWNVAIYRFNWGITHYIYFLGFQNTIKRWQSSSVMLEQRWLVFARFSFEKPRWPFLRWLYKILVLRPDSRIYGWTISNVECTGNFLFDVIVSFAACITQLFR